MVVDENEGEEKSETAKSHGSAAVRRRALPLPKRKIGPKLQAAVYDILLWRKVPESGARSVSGRRTCTQYCQFSSIQSC